MGTYDFVKATGRDKYWALKEKEKKFMTDPKTGMLKKEFERRVKCPLCLADDTAPAFVKEGFQYVKCLKCGMLYINPQLDEGKMLSQYRSLPSQSYWVDVLQTPRQLAYDSKKFKKSLDEISLFVKPGKVLDIGCSLGIFLDLARKKGWDVDGIELNTKARKVAEEKFKLKLMGKPIDELNLADESYDLVTLWEVLEHLPDPNDMLNNCRKLLKKGGILVVLVPNCDSLAVRIMHEKCATFGWGHLWYFTPSTLSTLLARHGFEVFKTTTELGEMDTIINYLQFDDPYIGKGVKRKYKSPYLIPDAIKKSLSDQICINNLGYKLHVYARKK